MPSLGPGESLTPGGYVRRADGVVVVTPEAAALHDATKALENSLPGMTMAEITERLGNCDPIPAVTYSNGYSHSWSLPGFAFSILFGHDNKAVGLLNGSIALGGPPTPGLQARLASQAPTQKTKATSFLYGSLNPQVVCPHCQKRGNVYMKTKKVKKGVSGGKATGAILTGGISILATGLSRKEGVTQAHCAACGTTWTV